MSLIGTLCPECYREEIPLIRFKKSPSLIVCPQCSAIKSGSNWHYPPSDDFAQFVRSFATKVVKESLDLPASNELVAIDPTFLMDTPSKEVAITISLKRYGITSDGHIEKAQLSLPLEYQPCPRCSRIQRGSYEAILQIRGARGCLSPKEREILLSTIAHTLNLHFKEHPLSFVTKIVQKNEGMDLYFGSSKCATAIAYSLRDSVAASIKTSSKLVGVDKSGKRRYRVYISIRIPHLRVGDFLILDNSLYELHAIGGSKITLHNVETGAHRSLLVNTLWSQLSHRQIEILPREDHVSNYLIIAITSDSFQVMNMKTYETYEVKKIVDKSLKNGDIVEGFQINGRIFLL